MSEHEETPNMRIHSKFAGGTVFAIAEAVEDPRPGGRLLRREIVRIVNGGEANE